MDRSEQSLTVMRRPGLPETLETCKHLAKSGYFQDAKELSQAVTKVLAGQELGFAPIASMTGIYIIKQKVSLSANLIAAIIKRHADYDYRVKKLNNDVCAIDFLERGEVVGESVFTLEDAKRAGTGNLGKFPRNMLFARAMSNGVKWFCPHLTSGAPVYTPEELGQDVDDDGAIIEGEIVPDKIVKARESVKRAWVDRGKEQGRLSDIPTREEYAALVDCLGGFIPALNEAVGGFDGLRDAGLLLLDSTFLKPEQEEVPDPEDLTSIDPETAAMERELDDNSPIAPGTAPHYSDN